jgi:outer membrane protein assembly factor BamB
MPSSSPRLPILTLLAASLLLAVSPASAQQVYVAGSSGQLALANPTTGSLSTLATLRDSVTNEPIIVSGMAFSRAGDRLYGVIGVDGAGDAFWTFDPATGRTTDLDSLGVALVTLAARPSDGLLFGFANDDPANGTARLYSLDPGQAAPVPTLLGDMGFLTFGALAFDDTGRLFATDSLTGDLYRVNDATGAASLVGATSVAPILGLASSGGTMYGFGEDRNVYSLDLSTGAANPAAPYSFGSGSPDLVYAAAVRPVASAAVPEPATGGLLALAASAAALRARRRRNP